MINSIKQLFQQITQLELSIMELKCSEIYTLALINEIDKVIGLALATIFQQFKQLELRAKMLGDILVLHIPSS